MIINGSTYNDQADRLDLLWENPNPDTSIAAFSITKSYLGYKTFYILFKADVADGAYTGIHVSQIINDKLLNKQCISAYSGYTVGYRTIELTDTGFNISNAAVVNYTSAGGSALSNDASFIVPYRIYGAY